MVAAERIWTVARVLACVCAVVIATAVGTAAGVELSAERHPSLLFTDEQISVLKERILREPYATWWQTVSARAESAPTSFSEERSKARYAKSLAFAYLMTDDATLAERAVDLLLDMKFPPRGGDLGEPHNEGEAVAIYAVAYDMLHTFLEDQPESLAEIRTILAEEAERLRKGVVIFEQDLGFLGTLKIRLHKTPDPRDVSVTHLDNWHIRAYGGLGLAALALADHAGLDGKTPQDWLDRAHDLVTRSIAHQVDETDGSYAEGPFYSRYAADVYLPYMFALKELTGTDLFVDPKVQDMHDWSVNIRLPNGLRPNIEDGHLSNFYGHYLASVDADGGVHRWDWENNIRGLYVRQFSEMDAIAFYDDSVAAVEPTRGPTVFMPEAGDAVFRSDWSSAATYMLLRGEHDRAREQGLGHEHPDETSFVIYAGGEMLALDAGYINFTNHSKVNSGRNHNVILVDGVGPPLVTVAGESVDGGNDAFIEEFFTSDFMDYAEVRAGYGDVGFRRRVMFAGKAYFVVGDEVRADASHLYEWRLHGNGGGTSGGSYERAGNLARWSRSGAELLAYLPERDGRTFAETDTLHSFEFLEEITHTALQVQERATDTEFLSVLFPRSLDPVAEEPLLSNPAASGGQAVRISMAAGDDFAWIGAAASDTVRVATDAGEIATDGRFGFARISDGVVTAFNVQDGSFLSLAGVQVFSAAAAIDVSLAFADSGLSGFLRGSQDGYQVVVQTADSVAAVTYQDAAAASVYGDGAVTLQLFGEGQLAADTIPIALIPANVPPAAAGQSVSTDEDTPISLTLTGTDADGDELTFAIADQPSGGTVFLNGGIAFYSPTGNFSGADSFTFTAGDGVSISAVATVSIAVAPVNDPPTVSAFSDQSVEANSGVVSLSLITGSGGGSDEAAQTVVVTATSSDPSVVPHPTVSGGTVSFAPVADASGSVVITVTADDGQGANNLAVETFEITVSPPTVTLPTDYDGNGRVDLFDFFLFADAFGEPVDEDSTRFDLDGNGRVDLFDFFIFADSFGATVHFLDGTDG